MSKFLSRFLDHTIALCMLSLGTTAQAFELPEAKRPIDIQHTDNQFAVTTLKDTKKQQGTFALGGALINIGRTDLTGPISFAETFPGELNSQLSNAGSFNEFEQPLGGHFPLPNEKPVSLRTRNTNGLLSTNRMRYRSAN